MLTRHSALRSLLPCYPRRSSLPVQHGEQLVQNLLAIGAESIVLIFIGHPQPDTRDVPGCLFGKSSLYVHILVIDRRHRRYRARLEFAHVVETRPAFEFCQALRRLYERSQIRIIVEHPRVDHFACEENRLSRYAIKLGEFRAYPLRSPLGCLLLQITRFVEQGIDWICLEI